MMLRTIDQLTELCNGTHLIINQLWDHIVEATILKGRNKEKKVFVPRNTLIPSNTTHLPTSLQRRQFSWNYILQRLSIKSQGQLLSHVWLFDRNLYSAWCSIVQHLVLYFTFNMIRKATSKKNMVIGLLEPNTVYARGDPNQHPVSSICP